MLPTAVRTITKDEREKALDIFTLAFVDDPVLRWIMADGSLYLKNLGAAQFALGGRWSMARRIAWMIFRRPRSGCRRAWVSTKRLWVH